MTEKDFEKIMRKKMSSLFIGITDKCNLRCRHCINRDRDGGISIGEADPEEVLNWIAQVPGTEYRNINFVGGEPFLCQDNLRKYIQKTAELKLSPVVTTNGFWATSEERAIDLLQSLTGIKSVFISTDLYHLEFIKREVINHLVNACLKLNIQTVINAACANREEENKIKELYQHFVGSKIIINTYRLFPEGAARELPVERFQYFKDIETLPDICNVHNHYIDYLGRMDACCFATMGVETNFLFLGQLRQENLRDIITRRNANPIFNFINQSGPRGLAKLMVKSPFYDELKETSFANECELCIKILGHRDRYRYIMETLNVAAVQ